MEMIEDRCEIVGVLLPAWWFKTMTASSAAQIGGDEPKVLGQTARMKKRPAMIGEAAMDEDHGQTFAGFAHVEGAVCMSDVVFLELTWRHDLFSIQLKKTACSGARRSDGGWSSSRMVRGCVDDVSFRNTPPETNAIVLGC